MQTFSRIHELQNALEGYRPANSIAFVPTMGNLHDGHLSLVKHAKQKADIVVVSIFVNPLQFGANEDLDKYPRTLAEDSEKLISAGVDILFTPTPNEIYPLGLDKQTQVCVPDITKHHCGGSRPGHFDGVSTIVNKLFNIVQPTIAIFGEKDFQQLAVIRKMVSDLCMPINIIGAPTGRADDGLALSSRNQYLNASERLIAPLIYQTLLLCKKNLLSSRKNSENIQLDAIKTLENAGFRVDYFNICDSTTLEMLDNNSTEIVILAAAFLGKTRLIDNICFAIEP
jgi:pantoate--beta-alanine ligase